MISFIAVSLYLLLLSTCIRDGFLGTCSLPSLLETRDDIANEPSLSNILDDAPLHMYRPVEYLVTHEGGLAYLDAIRLNCNEAASIGQP